MHKTFEHIEFNNYSRLDKFSREGFWHYTTERLFYLNDLIAQYDLKNTFHIENDTLIYVDLEELLPVFIKNYSGIAAPFESDDRGSASFLFVPNPQSMHAFARYLMKHAASGLSDMFLLNHFKMECGEKYIDHLPTVMPEYITEHSLMNLFGKRTTIDPKCFCKNSDQFQSLFDGCAYGQYLGGIDQRNGPDGPGFINKEAFFLVSYMDIVWESDAFGRQIPFAIYDEKKYRINNLHIHSKNLNLFSSGRSM
jgi:hypothetical protein